MTQGAGELKPGAIVAGTYEVLSLLGRGGMGAVWLARHRRLRDKHVAIKVLLGSHASGEAYHRFAREAEIAARIGHPNIVDVLDFNELDSGAPYIVLEYLQGESLRSRLEKGPLATAEAFAIARQIGSALHAAHRHGVVHRDLKPENVFLVPTDSGGVLHTHVKVLDFGISKLRGSQSLQTQEATVLGTPQYMAPEQAAGRNQDVDGRTDVFALGAMVHEMLCGQPPFLADTPLGVMFKVVYEPTPPLAPRMPGLQAEAVAAIEKALAKEREARWQDVAAFVEALTGQPLQTLTRDRPASGAVAADVPVTWRSAQKTGPNEVDGETFAGTPPVALQVRAADGQVDGETLAGTPVGLPQVRGTDAEVSAETAVGTPPVALPVARPEPGPVPQPEPEPQPVLQTPDIAPEPLPQPPAPVGRDRRERNPRRRWILRAVLVALAFLWVAKRTRHDRPGREDDAPVHGHATLPEPVRVPEPVPEPARIPGPEPVPEPVRVPQPVRVPEPVRDPEPAHDSGPSAAAPVAHKRFAVEGPHATDLPEEAAEELRRADLAVTTAPAEALRLARHVLLSGKSPRVFGVLTRAHCQLGDLAAAQAMFRNVTGPEKARTLSACRAAGVTL